MKTLERARKHTITYKRPAPSFFEGALLGNGGLGAVVTTRPDSNGEETMTGKIITLDTVKGETIRLVQLNHVRRPED